MSKSMILWEVSAAEAKVWQQNMIPWVEKSNANIKANVINNNGDDDDDEWLNAIKVYVPGTVLSTFHDSSHLTLMTTLWVTIIIPIL